MDGDDTKGWGRSLSFLFRSLSLMSFDPNDHHPRFFSHCKFPFLASHTFASSDLTVPVNACTMYNTQPRPHLHRCSDPSSHGLDSIGIVSLQQLRRFHLANIKLIDLARPSARNAPVHHPRASLHPSGPATHQQIHIGRLDLDDLLLLLYLLRRVSRP